MRQLTDRVREEIIRMLCREITGRLTASGQERLRELEEEYGVETIDRLRVVRRLQQKKEFGHTEAWEDFKNRAGAGRSSGKQRRIGWRAGTAVAAVVVAAIGIASFVGIQQRKDRFHDSLSMQQIICPGRSVATITLSNGERLEVGNDRQTVSEKSGALMKMDSAVVTYQGTTAETQEMVYHTLSIPVGGEYRLVLADGTKVWMNAASELKYPVAFSGKQREVFLEGEAYFEVYRDPAHPFLVHTSRGTVKVLGTGFNVRDYRDEAKVVTTLVEGKVAYLPENRTEEIVLTPGYQVEDREGTELRPRLVDVGMYVGWKDGKYIFENASLEEIMQVLSRWYDVAVFYKREDVKHLHFTGDLERYENINVFLEFMEIGGDVRFEIKGKTITIE